jgi:hypothetical protein
LGKDIDNTGKKRMSDITVPGELTSERLLEFVRHISAVIGPRHPASPAERETANYIHSVIRQIDPEWELTNQPFRSADHFSYRIAPLATVTGISLLWALHRSLKSEIMGGLASIGLSIYSRDAFLQRQAVWESWMPRGESQNVIVRIPPRKHALRRIVLVAHLDSGTHRVTADSRIVRQLPRTLGGITLMALVGGVLSVLAGRKGRWRGLRALLGLSALGGAGLALLDEMGPDVAGANGNASGVSVLLGIAEALKRRPRDHTEVILAFTGAATALGIGVDELATKCGKEWADALWIVVDNVGTGELAWGTREGISPYAYYYPHIDAVEVMERVAEARPDLGLMGKQVVTLDELAILRDRDLRAVTLTAYDRATGLIPNWRQNSDTIHEIDPETLGRAAQALWTAIRVVDQADTWPFNC